MPIFPSLLRRLRFKAGHGVHSPFAFRLISLIINEDALYYFYKEIDLAANQQAKNKQIIPYSIYGQLQSNKAIRRIVHTHCPIKKEHLLFRLANHTQGLKQLHIGSDFGLATIALSGFSTKCQVDLIESSQGVSEILANSALNNKLSSTEMSDRSAESVLEGYTNELYELIYISRFNQITDPLLMADRLTNLLQENSLLIVDGINCNRQAKVLWKALRKKDPFTLSIDLYHLGLLFVKPQMYKISYNAYL